MGIRTRSFVRAGPGKHKESKNIYNGYYAASNDWICQLPPKYFRINYYDVKQLVRKTKLISFTAPEGEKFSSLCGNMEAKSCHNARNMNLRAHILNHKDKTKGMTQKWVNAIKSPNPCLLLYFLQQLNVVEHWTSVHVKNERNA